jgi:hypothetical protein
MPIRHPEASSRAEIEVLKADELAKKKFDFVFYYTNVNPPPKQFLVNFKKKLPEIARFALYGSNQF